MAKTESKRARLSIDLPPEGPRRIRVAAAKRDTSIRKYVLETVEHRLKEDLGVEGHDHLVDSRCGSGFSETLG